MTEQAKLFEKEGTVLADENEAGPYGSHSNFNKVDTKAIKLPKMDELLEEALANVKPAGSLTKREMEILKLIVDGKTNKKIAQALYRTERTVEYHRNRLMRKLGTHNAANLVKRAIAMGIV